MLEPIIRDMNPWLSSGAVPDHLTGILRESYLKEFEKSLEAKEISIISGMRRTGKTTIMYQLIKYLMNHLFLNQST